MSMSETLDLAAQVNWATLDPKFAKVWIQCHVNVCRNRGKAQGPSFWAASYEPSIGSRPAPAGQPLTS